MSPIFLRRRNTRAASISTPAKIPASLSVVGLMCLHPALAYSSTCPDTPTASTFETFKFILSVIGYLGALTVFFVGLSQYKRADYWKRAEFLAKDLKDFLDEERVSTALTLMDWGVRYVDLGVKEADATVEHRRDETLVDRALQCSALRPHTILSLTGASDSVRGFSIAPASDRSVVRDTTDETAVPHSDAMDTTERVSPPDASSVSLPTTGGAAFGPEEAAIRDCYDKLLDGLNRYGNYLSGELVSVDDLEPYLGYWIRDIANTDCDSADAFWSLCLLAYIDFYAFLGVQSLFKGFDLDIGIEGTLAQTFLKQSPDFVKATALVEHVIAEKQRTLPARTKTPP
jgi:hypothetical protein